MKRKVLICILLSVVILGVSSFFIFNNNDKDDNADENIIPVIQNTYQDDEVILDADKNIEFSVSSNVVLTNSNLSTYVEVISKYNEIPSVEVRSENDYYVIYPTIGYIEGETYTITLTPGVNFTNNENVSQITFSIHKEETLIYDYKDDIKHLKKDNIKEENNDYFVVEDNQYSIGDTIAVGNGKNIDEDSDIVKVTDIKQENGLTYIYYGEPEIEEVYKELDIYTEQPIDYSSINLEDINIEELKNQIKNSKIYESFVTTVSRNIKEEYGYLASNHDFNIDVKTVIKKTSFEVNVQMVYEYKNISIELSFNNSYELETKTNMKLKIFKRYLSFDCNAKLISNSSVSLSFAYTYDISNIKSIEDRIEKSQKKDRDRLGRDILNDMKNIEEADEGIKVPLIKPFQYTIPNTVITVNLDLDFILQLSARVELNYSFVSKKVEVYGIRRTADGVEQYNTKTDKLTSSTLTLKGELQLRVGINLDIYFSIVGWRKHIKLGVTAECGLYVRLGGMVVLTSSNRGNVPSTYYFEYGFFVEASIFYQVFKINGSFELVNIDKPFCQKGSKNIYFSIKGGLDQLHLYKTSTSINTTYEVEYLNLDDLKIYTSNFNGNDLKFEFNKNYLSYKNNAIALTGGAPNYFEAILTISLKSDQYVKKEIPIIYSKPHEGYLYKKVANKNEYEITSYVGNETVVKIPSSINGVLVVGVASNAFINNKNITKVITPESVRYLGQSAFEGCDKLNTFVVKKSVTSKDTVMKIESNTFKNANNLKNIVVPYGNYQYYSNATYWSNRIDTLKHTYKITFNNYEGSSDEHFVEEGKTFQPLEPSAREDYIFAGWYIDESFEEQFTDQTVINNDINIYQKWTPIIYSIAFDTNGGSEVNPILKARYSEIDAPTPPTKDAYVFSGWYTDNTYSTLYEFSSMPGEDITLFAKWELYIDQVLELKLLENDTYSVIGVKDNKITSYDIPKYHYGKLVVAIESNAFSNCLSLNSITIPNSIKIIENNAFDGCISLESVTIPNGVESIGASAFKNNYSLKSIVIPDTVSKINDNTFMNNSSLKDIVIPNSVTFIGEHAFSECHKLENVVLPVGLTAISNYAFYNCINLKSINLPITLQTLGISAFENTSLTDIELPDGIKKIEDRTFYNCKSLTNVILSNNLVYIGYQAFYNNTSLLSIDIPGSVMEIKYNALLNCSSLSNINVDISNLDYSSASGVLFSGDKKTLIKYPEGKTDSAYSIPQDVTTVDRIAFMNSQLESVTIPLSVTKIEYFAFAYTSTALYCEAESQPVGWESDFNPNNNLIIWGTNKFTIAFDSNGGSDVEPITKLYNSPVRKPVAPTKEGHTFAGWYRDLEFSRPYIFTTMPSEDITLYARWNVNEYVLIINDMYNEINEIKVKFNEEIPVPVDPEVEGLVFMGWYTDEQYVTLYEFSTMPSHDVFIYARWEVYMDEGLELAMLDDGTYSVVGFKDPNTISYDIPKYHNLTLITTIADEAFSNCTSLKSITLPNSLTVIGNNAFANCTSLNSVTLSNSVIVIGNFAFENCTALENILIPINVSIVAEYAFNDCLSLTIYSEALDKPLEWEPYWNPNDRPVVWGVNNYTISFDSNGGTLVESITQVYNSIVEEPIEPIKEGHTFAGWYSDPELTNLYEFTIMPTEDITLYAAWTINEYMVIYYTGFGDDFKYVKYGDLIPRPDDPVEEGFVFKGWYPDEQYVDYFEFTTMPSYDVLIFARWDVYYDEGLELVMQEDGTYSVVGFKDPYTTSYVIPKYHDLIPITTIADEAFSNCVNLKTITLPDSISTIGSNAFYNCTSLESIVIPNSVTTIGENAFKDNLVLTIYCEIDSKPDGWDVDWNPDLLPIVWNYIENDN